MKERDLALSALAVFIVAVISWNKWFDRGSVLAEARFEPVLISSGANNHTPPLSLRSQAGSHAENSSAPPAAPARSTLADQLNSPATDIHADLRLLDEIFATFRSNFAHQGNPIGNNAEITAVLTGKNSLGLAVIPPDLPAINAKGELCDRWGHPFFFHQISGTKMEIRSAGPDKKFWTADDIVYTP